MKIKPLYDRIIVKRDEKEDTTSSGIILSQTTEKPNQGTVTAVGNGLIIENGTIIPLQVQVGDKVLFGRNVGIESKIGTESFLILKETDVLGIIEE